VSKKRKPRSRKSVRPRRPPGIPQLETPEGDPLAFASVKYQHTDPQEIRRILGQAGDFGLDDDLQPAPDGSIQFAWFETASGAPALAEPLERRILATLALTSTTLTVETLSRRRRRACRHRLEQLLGNRIQLLDMETRSAEQVLREPSPQPEPKPLELPPEVVAELEERMIRQWLDESIPALGGLTPREAAKTPEGRRRLDALFDYIARSQAGREMAPGMFSPDYRQAKKMLGLE
jgi:hypothetical protein